MLFKKTTEYIADLSYLDSMKKKNNPKFIIKVSENFVELIFSYTKGKLFELKNGETLFQSLEIKERFEVLGNEMSANEWRILTSINYLRDYVELNTISQILNEFFIKRNKEWFKNNIPEFYENYVKYYEKTWNIRDW